MKIERAHLFDGSEYLKLPEGIVLHQGKWRRGLNELITVHASTCIVLAAHNDQTNEGLLGHFSAINPLDLWRYPHLPREHTDIDAFEEAVQNIPLIGPAEHTSIWLGGGSMHDEGDELERSEVVFDREYALHKLDELGLFYNIRRELISIGWSEFWDNLHVRLDCPSGTLTIHSERDEQIK